MNPGVLLNGLFWTMELPDDSFYVSRDGSHASLNLHGLPLANTLVFAGDRAIASSVDVSIEWNATSSRVRRGLGRSVPSDDPGAFIGRFADAECTGVVQGRQTGFSFETGDLSSDTFFAEMGQERNGVFL